MYSITFFVCSEILKLIQSILHLINIICLGSRTNLLSWDSSHANCITCSLVFKSLLATYFFKKRIDFILCNCTLIHVFHARINFTCLHFHIFKYFLKLFNWVTNTLRIHLFHCSLQSGNSIFHRLAHLLCPRCTFNFRRQRLHFDPEPPNILRFFPISYNSFSMDFSVIHLTFIHTIKNFLSFILFLGI